MLGKDLNDKRDVQLPVFNQVASAAQTFYDKEKVHRVSVQLYERQNIIKGIQRN
jgi:hypothetical protein